MSIYLLMLIIPPILVSVISWVIFHHRITAIEFGAQAIVPALLAWACFALSVSSMTSSSEVLSGKVTGKASREVSCSHSYDCRCYRDKKGNRRCSTCYDHSHDVDWDVATTLGTYTISRVDRQGLDTPDRWNVVKTGDPVATTAWYTNYVKGAPNSIFNMAKIVAYKKHIPDYPHVYDYYNIDRFITTSGIKVPDKDAWNLTLANHLREVGAEHQVNVNVVVTDLAPNFAEALEAAWYGGEKNDVTVVIGAKYPNIQWVKVFSWSKTDMVNVTIRNNLLDSKILHPNVTVPIIVDAITQHYRRKPMSDFKYLETEVIPSAAALIFISLLSVALSIGIGICSVKNNVNPITRKYFKS